MEILMAEHLEQVLAVMMGFVMAVPMVLKKAEKLVGWKV
jgi:hypothetical protein